MAYNNETEMYEGYIYKIWNDVNNKIYIGQTKQTIKDRWHGHMSAALSDKRYKSALYNAMRKYGRDKFHIEEICKIEDTSYEELCKRLDYLETTEIKKYNSYAVSGNGYNLEHGGVGKNKKIDGRRVCKYDDDLNLLDTYISLQEAGRMNDIDGATIWAVCNHKYYRAAGYIWAYEGDVPVKPPSKKEIKDKAVAAYKETVRKRPKKDKVENPYKSQTLDPDVKRKNRLDRLGWNGKKIVQYNAYGEIINEYNDMIDAIENIPISAQELRKNLNGENLHYNKTVLRYEDVPFDHYPCSLNLQPVVLYDLQGNYIQRFESHKDAEDYLGAPSGEITKVLKRGGSIKKHLVSPYGEKIIRKLSRLEKTYEMLDDDYNVIRTFNSYKEIANEFELIDCSSVVRDAIRNQIKFRGYYWRYMEEYPVSA